jgi:orotate phosphoribosyltransferase-like protein
MSTKNNKGKCERALELHDKGLTPTQIAERLGSNPRSVAAMICNAKKRRAEKVEA